jgi:hypothetical protein
MCDTPHAKVHDRQLSVLHEINQLSSPRKGIMEMEVDVRLPSMRSVPSMFMKQDICSVITSHKDLKVLIYFGPKYTLDKKGRGELLADLTRSALLGGDSLISFGKGSSKGQCLYIRCQCAAIYTGSKYDKAKGQIVGRTDYRKTTYCNDRKNNRPGKKGRNASHRTTIDRRVSKDEECCTFSFPVFQDASGYFMKSHLGCVSHQYHPRRDYLRNPTSLLTEEDNQLHADLNSARAKIGTAANLHYVRSARKGTPTVLSRGQIQHLMKKTSVAKGGNTAEEDDENGEIDDIYQFLEETGNYYVSLLARVDQPASVTSPDPLETMSKSTLFNETRIGYYTGTEDIVVAGDEEAEMLRVVGDHRRVLNIKDTQEMMVGIAYGMPFELEQFGLFHVSLHIDATSDSNKEGRPLVTVTSKDSYGRMFFVLRCFLPSEQSWAYRWLFQTVFPSLIGKDVLNKVNIVVTDGDSQEITQLEEAVNKFFPQVYRL